MDFDACVEEKSGLGTAGIVVINKDQDIIKCMARIARFYKHESCGQCTPCREGSGWMWRMLERMAKGDATKDEVDMLGCLLYTSPSPRDATLSRMPSSA